MALGRLGITKGAFASSWSDSGELAAVLPRPGLDQVQIFLEQWRQFDVGGGDRVIEQGDVQAPADQRFVHGAGQRLGDGQGGLGHLAPESMNQRHGHQPGDAGRQTHRHTPRQRAAHPTEFLARALDLMQDAAPVRQQQLAGLGGHRAPPVSDQQVLPQLHLEQAHLTAQGGLGHVQGRRRPGEAAQLGHTDEVFDLFEVHGS
jgi:hypothetical protein